MTFQFAARRTRASRRAPASPGRTAPPGPPDRRRASANGAAVAEGVDEHPAVPHLDRQPDQAVRGRVERRDLAEPGRRDQRAGQVVAPGVVRADDGALGRRPPSGSSSWPRCRQVFANAATSPAASRDSRTGTSPTVVATWVAAVGEHRPPTRPRQAQDAGEEVPPLPGQHGLATCRPRRAAWCSRRTAAEPGPAARATRGAAVMTHLHGATARRVRAWPDARSRSDARRSCGRPSTRSTRRGFAHTRVADVASSARHQHRPGLLPLRVQGRAAVGGLRVRRRA